MPISPHPTRQSHPGLLAADLFRSCAEGMIIIDQHGTVLAFNPSAERVFGHAAADVVGRNVSMLMPPPYCEEHNQYIADYVRSREGKVMGFARPTVGLRGDGTVVPLHLVIMQMHSRGRLCFAAVAHDLHADPQAMQRWRTFQQGLEERVVRTTAELTATREQRAKAETHLIEAERLELVGQLAASTAHEVKNPLAILQMGLDYLHGRAAARDEQTIAVLEDMDHAIHRASATLHELLELSSPALKLECEDLNEVVHRSLRMVAYKLSRSHIVVREELAEGLRQIHIDSGRLEQVLVNLLLNAIEAMAQGGTLTVRTSGGTYVADLCPAAQSRAVPLTAGQPVAIVDVEDSGPGIPQEQVDRLFEPFFTLKPQGKGNGLGLYVSRRITEMHGGALCLMNRPDGKGARARVLLPLGKGGAPCEETNESS